MKKRPREVPVQFFVYPEEKKEIQETMERNGFSNLSDFMRILALSKAEINFSVKVPNVLRVSEAGFEAPEEVREKKRAVG